MQLGGLGNVDLWSLLKPIFESDLEVIFVALGGYLLARNGFLTRQSQKVLSNLNVYFFMSCLVFEKIAGSLTLESLIDLWLLPILYTIITAASVFVAYVLARIFRLSKRERNFATACIAFQNSNSLPLAMITSLAATADGLLWDRVPNDSRAQVTSRGIMYLLIFSQLGQALRWSYGFRVLLGPNQPPDELDEMPPSESISVYEQAAEQERLLGTSNDESELAALTANEGIPTDERNLTAFRDALAHKHGHLVKPPQPVSNSTSTIVESDADISTKSRFRKAVVLILDFFSPPLYSMLLALFVAMVPPIQRLFFEKGAFLERSITSGVRMAGRAAVPQILVVLGASLATDMTGNGPDAVDSYRRKHPNREKRLIFVCLFGRMIAVPLLLLPLFAIVARYTPFSTFDDPIFVVVIFLLVGSPTAIQLTQICQLNGVFERECAIILWWSYVVLTPPNSLVLNLASLLVVKWAK
ncbi:auxin family transmembrane transporter [Schizosaccharomyces japonicus yFS275]|uniref:Auxin family transmembrane transporter n=1 Tax=Schizosaccharomyces japonicus (strain yFS275 / FY16936) TaxID=402676 RepID=B6JY55_SCHJY|nr:auxin family transmembrane transporter [Schizosaccharomyces japonicus yFS275]EEB06473.2 auxin family transmembrane transporter [Schizosaccharomyces japonicus yFS275]